MKALYLDSLPPDYQQIKDRQPERVSVMGALVCFSDFVDALVRYSSYDELLFPKYQSVTEKVAAEQHQSDRIRLVDHEDLSKLRDEHLVFASLNTNLADLVRLRRLSDTLQAPVTGVTHSLNLSTTIQQMMQCFATPLTGYDALVCTSSAGQRVVQNFFALIREHFDLTDDWTRRHPTLQTPVIPLGVNADSFAGAPLSTAPDVSVQDGPVVLYFGRFSPTGKADMLPLILAFSEVLAAGSQATLIIAGDDTQFHIAADLESFAASVGCRDRVRIVPNPSIAQKRALYRQADVFVSLADSIQETFGLTILEAMAAGLPVIASDWDGYVDLVVHQETGYLIPTYLPDFSRAFDDLRGIGHMRTPDPLAAATVVDMSGFKRHLLTLLQTPALRRELGAAGRLRVFEHFDWRRVITRYESLWSELVAAGRSCQPVKRDHYRDLLRWSYSEIFGHYATGFLSSSSLIRITETGREWLTSGELLTSGRLGAWFEPAELISILRRLESADLVSLNQLCEGSLNDASAEISRISNVHRLVKYGLAEVAVANIRSTRTGDGRQHTPPLPLTVQHAAVAL